MLEVETRRGTLVHLGHLAGIGLYERDRQIHEVRYRWRVGTAVQYVVRLWRLTDD